MSEETKKVPGAIEEDTENKPEDTENEPRKKVKLAGFQKICPYEFLNMLPCDCNEETIRDHLAYEVFNASTDMEDTAFENFMKTLGFGQFIFKAIDEYNERWKATEVSDRRNILYPIDTDKNRTDNKSETSEIAVVIEAVEKSNGKYSIEEVSNETTFQYLIKDKNGRSLYEIMPCCPLCYTLLPEFWFKSSTKDYIPISLVAGKSGGKTTYMASLLSGRFKELTSAVRKINHWVVRSAISYEQDRMKIQDKRIKAQKKLEAGEFPEPTTTSGMLPPVFINIANMNNKDTHKGEEVIVGIFDCAGEFFKNIGNSLTDDERVNFLKYMRAYIYFVEASQIPGVSSDTFKRKKDVNKIEIQSIKKQGELQSDSSKTFYAKDTLCTTDESKSVEEEAFEILQLIDETINGWYRKGIECSLKHIAYTIIKSDQLKKLSDKLSKFPRMSGMLDKPSSDINQFDLNVQRISNAVVKEFFEEVIVGKNNINIDFDLLEQVGNLNCSYSWHCVSVASEQVNDPNKCKFEPVRVSEPLFACVSESIKKLDWKM